MKDDPVVAMAAAFGPTLKAAFPNEHSVTRFQVANALAETALNVAESEVTASLQAENARLREALRMAQAIIESRLPERTSALLVIRAALQHGGNDG